MYPAAYSDSTGSMLGDLGADFRLHGDDGTGRKGVASLQMSGSY